MNMPMHGIWIDDPIRVVRTPAFWDLVKQHRLTTAALMVETFGSGFDPKYKIADLETIKGLALERDIEIVLTVCPEPNRRYIGELEHHIAEMLVASGASGLEFDLEGNWLPVKLDGFASLDAAGDELVAAFHSISMQFDVRTEVTTYPFHNENSKTADVAPHASRVLPQAYSVRHRDGLVDWSGRYGPGGMQRLTIDRALLIQGVGSSSGPAVSCGLAAYDQVWPGKTGEEAMHAAYKAAVVFNPLEIRFWSSKWVFGSQANGYASRFIKTLK